MRLQTSSCTSIPQDAIYRPVTAEAAAEAAEAAAAEASAEAAATDNSAALHLILYSKTRSFQRERVFNNVIIISLLLLILRCFYIFVVI